MSRLEMLRGLLEPCRIDALMLTSPVVRRYATGLNTSAGVVVITRGGGFFLTDFRYIEEARAKAHGYAVVMTSRENPQAAAVLEALGGARRAGFEADAMTCAELDRWREKLPKVTFVPAHEAVRSLRAVKDGTELAAMTRAQRIAESALRELLGGVLRAGMTERQVCAEIVYRMLKNGADGLSFDPIVVSGPNSSKPHGEPSDRVIVNGDFVTMDFGCKYDGYCSDMTRTVAMGEATDEMRHVYDIVLRAQTAGIAAARAGVPGKALDRAAREIIEAEGFGEFFGHGFGHGLGLEIHETPSANQAGEEPLPSGAVVSAEPGIYLPGRFGVRIEDVIVITDGGCQNLTAAEKKLTIIGNGIYN